MSEGRKVIHLGAERKKRGIKTARFLRAAKKNNFSEEYPGCRSAAAGSGLLVLGFALMVNSKEPIGSYSLNNLGGMGFTVEILAIGAMLWSILRMEGIISYDK